MSINIKVVPGHEWCSVSEDGVCYSTRTGKPYTPHNVKGYLRVGTNLAGKVSVKITVHRAVALAFLSNPENLPQINHKDGDKLNNSVSNLEWCDGFYNQQHTIKTGLRVIRYGESTSNNVYSEHTIREVCSMIEQGYRNTDIIKKVGCDVKLPSDIRNKVSWSHISDEYNIIKVRRGRLSEDTVRWVCDKLVEGCTVLQIYNLSNNKSLTISMIKHIKKKNAYKDIVKEYNF